MNFNESTVENATLEWFHNLGYSVAHGPNLAPRVVFPSKSGQGNEFGKGGENGGGGTALGDSKLSTSGHRAEA